MKPEDEDYRAMKLLLKSDGISKSRDALIANLQKEMDKSGEGPNPEHIDGMVKSLYALDGQPLPSLSGDQLETVIRDLKNRSVKHSRRPLSKGAFRFVRWASAACVVLLFFVFLNLGLAWATGGCLLRKVDKEFCSHTIFCPADGEEVPESSPNQGTGIGILFPHGS
ncbi:hypothetical protein [Treponema primitia]|uniref:hypothetical protein n=1 Tax=Treponema primitia TaxID=88058 RepID=UPI00025553CA|nr:hypothetical protein [Treponema primitia]